MTTVSDFHCQACDRNFERIKLPGNHIQRRIICEPCREWFFWCSTCRRAKLHSEFAKQERSSVRHQTTCNECLVKVRGNIKIRQCAGCLCEFMVKNTTRYNGRSTWLCEDCYLTVKFCGKCNEMKAVEEFNLSGGKRVGRAAHCRTCQSAKWEASTHRVRTRAKWSKFGMSYEQYQAMREAQGDLCLICQKPETDRHQSGSVAKAGAIRSLAIDHDHDTGEVRGLLCGKCNKVLGLMFDDPNLLRAAADYLDRFSSYSWKFKSA